MLHDLTFLFLKTVFKSLRRGGEIQSGTCFFNSTDIVFSASSLLNTSLILSPGFSEYHCASNTFQEEVSIPFTSVMMSPAFNPAVAGGPLATTDSTITPLIFEGFSADGVRPIHAFCTVPNLIRSAVIFLTIFTGIENP